MGLVVPVTAGGLSDVDQTTQGAGKVLANTSSGGKAFSFQAPAITAATFSPWTPTDQSGAGLTLTLNGVQYYCKIGQLGIAWFDITYPSTANATAAAVSLPFTLQSVNFAGSISQSSLTLIYAPTGNGNIFRFFREPNTGGGAEANLTLSTGHFVGMVAGQTTS
jgi:hypothetical protein